MQDWLSQFNVTCLGIVVGIRPNLEPNLQGFWLNGLSSSKNYYNVLVFYWRQNHCHLLATLPRDCPIFE
jgi:hypothetical protein